MNGKRKQETHTKSSLYKHILKEKNQEKGQLEEPGIHCFGGTQTCITISYK
jgi:hypothetical protein